MRALIAALAITLLSVPALAQNAAPGDVYGFASQYIRTLSALEAIRGQALRDAKSDTNQLEGCIRSAEAFQLELNADIAALKSFHLAGESRANTPQQFAKILELKRDIYRELGTSCEQMMEGPKPGIDYGAIAANAPKLTARMDYLDKTLFDVTPLAFAALIRDKPDSQNHMSHLAITREQISSLEQTIKLDFGKKLDEPNPDYIVSAAGVLYFYLAKKGYKGSDEP